jgi:predicted NBD/HSP70 family sugar kinase
MDGRSLTDETLVGRPWSRLRLVEALYRRPASRTDLVRLTGLSRPTVSALVEELAQAGIVEEHEAETRPRRGSGRPPQVLSLVRGAAFAIGLDFGHNHVRVAVCDLSGEAVIDDWSAADVDHAPVESLDLATELVRTALRDAEIAPDRLLGVGMGIAAPVNSVTGSVESEGILPGWHGVRPAHEMQQRLALPVQIENDANLGALGELEFGRGQGVRNVLYVRLSAGIGAGLIVDGRLFRGATGVAGELGHVLVDPDGLICRCGNRGCLETLASPVAIAALLERSRREPVSVAQMLELIAIGDRGARRAVTEACAAIGRVIATTVNLFNPELVVVGGDLAAAGESVLEPIRAAIAQHAVPPSASTVEVVPGALGGSAEVLGAAALILSQSPKALVQYLETR